MTHSGFVMCTCWKNGTTKPPPVPARQIGMVEGFLSLLLPFEGHEREHDAFEAWLITACPHEDMDLALEHLGASSVIELRAALQQSPDLYQSLLKELPPHDGGTTAPDAAERACRELAAFRSASYENHFLVDTVSGRRCQAWHVYGGSDDHLRGGVDERGFRIIREGAHFSGKEVIFRALEIEQHPEFENGSWEWNEIVDVATGRLVRTGEVRIRYSEPEYLPPPRRLVAKTETRPAADFKLVLDQLESLFTASIRSGNPVTWF